MTKSSYGHTRVDDAASLKSEVNRSNGLGGVWGYTHTHAHLCTYAYGEIRKLMYTRVCQ